jgi:hypothetical protein
MVGDYAARRVRGSARVRHDTLLEPFPGAQAIDFGRVSAVDNCKVCLTRAMRVPCAMTLGSRFAKGRIGGDWGMASHRDGTRYHPRSACPD